MRSGGNCGSKGCSCRQPTPPLASDSGSPDEQGGRCGVCTLPSSPRSSSSRSRLGSMAGGEVSARGCLGTDTASPEGRKQLSPPVTRGSRHHRVGGRDWWALGGVVTGSPSQPGCWMLRDWPEVGQARGRRPRRGRRAEEDGGGDRSLPNSELRLQSWGGTRSARRAIWFRTPPRPEPHLPAQARAEPRFDEPRPGSCFAFCLSSPAFCLHLRSSVGAACWSLALVDVSLCFSPLLCLVAAG